MDLTIYDGKLARCFNPPLLKEGHGAPKAIPPCLRYLNWVFIIWIDLHIEHDFFLQNRRSWNQSLPWPTLCGRHIPFKGWFEGRMRLPLRLHLLACYCCLGRWQYLRGLLFDNFRRFYPKCVLNCLDPFCLLHYLPLWGKPPTSGRDSCPIPSPPYTW